MDTSRGKNGSLPVFLGQTLALDRGVVSDHVRLYRVRPKNASQAGLSTRYVQYVQSLSKDTPLRRFHVASNSSAPGMDVSLRLNVRNIIAQFGEYVTFTVPTTDEESTLAARSSPPQRTNAFARLGTGALSVAALSHLPESKRHAQGVDGLRGDWPWRLSTKCVT